MQAESELDDFYAGGALVDRRGLKHFPRLWCREGHYSSFGQLLFTPLAQQVQYCYDAGSHFILRHSAQAQKHCLWECFHPRACSADGLLSAL